MLKGNYPSVSHSLDSSPDKGSLARCGGIIAKKKGSFRSLPF